MKTLNVMLSNLGGRVVPIGYEGENLYTRVRINCIEVFADYPDATVSMVVNPPDGNMYPAIIEKSGVMVIWDISDAVLSSNGSGECQLTFTDGDVVRKSVVFGISINRSLIASGDPPEPVQEWIDKAEETAQEIAENAANLAKEDIVESYGSIAPAIIETASGAIASLSDGADGMLVKTLTVDIDPVQDLHGYDNPWPAGGGKNLLNPAVFNDSKYTINSDGSVTVTGADGRAWTSITDTLSLPAGTYTISKTPTTGTSDVRLSTEDYGTSHLFTSQITFTLSEAGSVKIKLAYSGVTYPTTQKVQIESGSTATAWSPYENICPISGWDSANVSRTGKNLLKNIVYQPNQTIIMLGQTENYWDAQKTYLKAGTYTISFDSLVAVGGVYFGKETPITTKLIAIGKNSMEFTVPTDGYYALWIYYSRGVTASNYSNFMVETGSTTSAYAPYVEGETIEYEFPQESKPVYGAKLTIWRDGSGELVVDHAKFKASDITSFNGITALNDGTGSYVYKVNYFQTNQNDGDIISDTYKRKYPVQSWEGLTYGEFAASTSLIITVPNGITTTAQAIEYFESNDAEFVYKLDTPVTYQLTNQQVLSLLKGQNNVWADTGNVSLEYPADTKLYIDARVAELQALILENISNS